MKLKPDLISAHRAGVGRLMGWIAALLVLAISGCGSDSGEQAQPPNIIFFILDDVGIDQMSAFGYGGAVGVPQTPVIDTLVKSGVMFRNT